MAADNETTTGQARDSSSKMPVGRQCACLLSIRRGFLKLVSRTLQLNGHLPRTTLTLFRHEDSVGEVYPSICRHETSRRSLRTGTGLTLSLSLSLSFTAFLPLFLSVSQDVAFNRIKVNATSNASHTARPRTFTNGTPYKALSASILSFPMIRGRVGRRIRGTRGPDFPRCGRELEMPAIPRSSCRFMDLGTYRCDAR